MAQWLKQSTSGTVKVGPFLDETDGKTAETGLTITQPDVRLSKNGGAFAQKAAAQTLTHDENGYYGLTLDATDRDTLGILTVHIHESGALPVWYDFMVVPANVWDSMFGADVLNVDVTQWLGTACKTPATAGVPKIDLDHVFGVILTEGGAGRLAAAFIKLFDVATPLTVADKALLSAANINTEVVDVLKTDVVTLPGQTAPPLTPTFEEMISWLYKAFRNRKDETATLWQLYADDQSTVDAKATVSDDGTTAIKQEIVTGP